MKKFYVVLASVLCLASLNAAEYKHSIGAEVGGLNGVSYKGFIFSNPNLALQADLAVGVFQARLHHNGESFAIPSNGYFDFTANPNVVYQGEISNGFSWFSGGGVSLGMMNNIKTPDNAPYGKFGINALAGVEYKIANAPVTVGIDFRPGYGLRFDKNNSFSFFDWKLAASVRYCF